MLEEVLHRLKQGGASGGLNSLLKTIFTNVIRLDTGSV